DRADTDAAREARVEGREAPQQGAVEAAEDLHVRPAARAGARDDIGVAVAVDVAGGHVDAPGEARIVGQEGPEDGQRRAVEDLDLGAATGAGAVMISSQPSRSTSPTATRTPPVKLGA